jgi:hypothetical protein
VGNCVSLMNAIADLVKDAQVAAVRSRTSTRGGKWVSMHGVLL